MNPNSRPPTPEPGGMRGSSRMHDPSEAEHDRIRRRAMNIAFAVIVALNIAHAGWVGVGGWDWLTILLLNLAALPLGVGVKVFELRFKMATEEHQQALRDLPRRKRLEYAGYTALIVAALALNAGLVTWALVGVWLYDFITYYHSRPERMRHIYAVTKTLDELRGFPAPWAWPLPVLLWSFFRSL